LEFLETLQSLTELSSSTLLILIGCAFVAGFIDAIAGGGGMLTVPALLSSGLPPHIALGTNKLAASFGSLTASYTFYRKKLFSPSFWTLSCVFTAIGAVAGTYAVSIMSVDILNKLLPIIIGFSALYALFNRVKPDHSNELPEKNSQTKQKQTIQGFILGFYDGFAGPGTGAFWTVSNLFLYKLNLLLASGLARAMNFISNVFSLFAFIALGHVNFVLGILMGGFLMLGAYTGAHSAIRFGNRFIRPIFTVVVSVMAMKLAAEAWF
jgi:hypothetical protein